MSVPGDERSRRARAWIFAALVVAAFAGALVLWISPSQLVRIFRDREALEAFLASRGAWAPVVLIALQAIQVILAPIPGHLIGMISGLLFGLWRGLLYSTIGGAAGTWSVLLLSRHLGRPVLRGLLGRRTIALAEEWSSQRSAAFYVVVFLLPFFPDDVACIAIGLSRLPIARMLPLIVLSRLPSHFLLCWFGANARRLPPGAWLWAGIAVVIVAVATLLA
ncbi:MAG: VTT domain-containing protein, partial [Candidatus Eisenbacteria bacterium]|nr:VTT domain-containing protein [Candidatus Eisenbacteria bacterium]